MKTAGHAHRNAAPRRARAKFHLREHRRAARASRCSGNFSAPIKLKGQSRERLAFLAAQGHRPLQPLGRAPAIRHRRAAGRRGRAPGRASHSRWMTGCARPSPPRCTMPRATRPSPPKRCSCPLKSLLADEMEVVDPDAIHAVREAARTPWARHCRTEFNASLRGFRPAPRRPMFPAPPWPAAR